MGLAKGAISLLLEEAARKPFTGSVAILGKQDVYVPRLQLRDLFQKFNLGIPAALETGSQMINDEVLFTALGFHTVSSIDYDDYNNSTDLFDLNSDVLPDRLRSKFDVVIDAGTLEHVFHLPNALKNVIDMTKVSGRIIHLSPASNCIDHGFYMFSPTLFVDFYKANDFEIDTSYVVRHHPEHDTKPWDIFEYIPGTWQDVSYGGLDSKIYGIFFILTKTEHSTGNVIPQQGFYVNIWDAQDANQAGEAGGVPAVPSWKRRAKRIAGLIPGARITRDVVRSILHLKPVGKRVLRRY